jgi:adenylate cyclase
VLAVGFVDLVGFTQTSRESGAADLQRLLERFERDTSLRVTAVGGRVIKMLGDEVLYVTDDVRAAAEVALETVAVHERDESLPQVRAGIALGPVLVRLGDVFGEPVNLASRLTSEARPSTVLVDLQAADALESDPSYELARLKHRSVSGYRALRPHVLRRAVASDA